jgi:hypothetical protein
VARHGPIDRIICPAPKKSQDKNLISPYYCLRKPALPSSVTNGYGYPFIIISSLFPMPGMPFRSSESPKFRLRRTPPRLLRWFVIFDYHKTLNLLSVVLRRRRTANAGMSIYPHQSYAQANHHAYYHSRGSSYHIRLDYLLMVDYYHNSLLDSIHTSVLGNREASPLNRRDGGDKMPRRKSTPAEQESEAQESPHCLPQWLIEDADILKEMIQWWKARESAAMEATFRRPLFRGKTRNTGIRISEEILDRAVAKAKEEKLKTGGNLSQLLEWLLWVYIGSPDDLVEK